MNICSLCFAPQLSPVGFQEVVPLPSLPSATGEEHLPYQLYKNPVMADLIALHSHSEGLHVILTPLPPSGCSFFIT